MKKNVIIVGAGLAGSLCALYMLKREYNVSIYERRPDMRKIKLVAGRSINLALSTRGWTALEKVEANKHVKRIAIPMPKRIKLASKVVDPEIGLVTCKKQCIM